MSELLEVQDSTTPSMGHNPMGTSGALHVLNVAVEPGQDSTLDRTWGGGMAKYEVCTQAGGDQQVGSAGPIIYYGYSISVATSAHAIMLRDGTSDSGAVVDSIPVSQGIGAKSVFPVGIYCSTGLWFDLNGATTGTVTVYYQQV